MTRFRDYWGLIIFLVSTALATQFHWLIKHQRPEEILQRSLIALAAGTAVSIIIIGLVEKLLTGSIRDQVRRVSAALWPGFLLVFTPFHVLLLCKWQGRCSY